MDAGYDPEHVANVFDEYGEREWDRHEDSPAARVSFHVHQTYLERYVRPPGRVLEVGAGAGRFTVELARLGARVVVTDVSPGQLLLNERHVREAGLEQAVEQRSIADVLDLSAFGDGAFDAVVCYGGPVSYVMDRGNDALAELLRVARPGGLVLVGVMSRDGTLRAFLDTVAAEAVEFGAEAMQRIFDTGDVSGPHASLAACHMYRWAELRELLGRQPCELVAASAANCLSVANTETCERWLREDPEVWERFLRWELEACAQPGAIDAGTHMLAVVRAR